MHWCRAGARSPIGSRTFSRALTTSKGFHRAEAHCETTGYFEIGTTFGIDRKQPPAQQDATTRTFPAASTQWPTNTDTGMRSGSVSWPVRGTGRNLSLLYRVAF